MKKYLILLAACLLILTGCSASNQNDKEIQDKPDEKLTTPDEEIIEDSEHADDEEIVEKEPEVSLLSDEEIETIMKDTYLNILSAPENQVISFREAIDEELMSSSVNMEEIFENGLDPNTALYEDIYNYFNPEIQQYITEEGMSLILTDRFILLMNPHNETVLSPTLSDFEVLEQNEDTFISKHWFNESSPTYESTFKLEDGTWKFSGAVQTDQ